MFSPMKVGKLLNAFPKREGLFLSRDVLYLGNFEEDYFLAV